MHSRAAAPVIDTIVHFGAGRGDDLGRHLERHARQVVLVEVQAENVQALERVAARHQGVRIIHAAVAAEPGTRTLYRLSLPELSSLRRPTGLLDLYPGIEVLEERRVEAVLPSDSLATLHLNPDGNNLLIIDVPGEELALAAALEEGGDLQTFSAVELRCGRNALYEGSSAAADILAWLKKRGYTVRPCSSDDDLDRPTWYLERDEYYLEAVKLSEKLKDLRQEYEDQIEQTSKARDQATQQINALEAERDEVAKELAASQRYLKEETRNREQLTERVSEMEEQLRREQDARKKADKRAKQREQESAEHQEQRQRLQRDYAELQARADRMREEISRAEAQIDLLAGLTGQEPDR